MEWVGDGIAAGAFVIAALGFWDSRRRAASAERSAAASEVRAQQAVEAARRSAAALETQATLAEAESERYEYPWVLVRDRGDTWRLTNSNRSEAAHDVFVDPYAERAGGLHDAPQGVMIGPGSSVVFFGVGAHQGQPDARVRVRWRRKPGGEVLEWVGNTA